MNASIPVVTTIVRVLRPNSGGSGGCSARAILGDAAKWKYPVMKEIHSKQSNSQSENFFQHWRKVQNAEDCIAHCAGANRIMQFAMSRRNAATFRSEWRLNAAARRSSSECGSDL
jgi:hypothetical protein